MSIFEKLDEYKASKQYETSQDEATKMYLEQKSAIQRIEESDGYKQIVLYLDREIDSAEMYLDVAKDEKQRREAFAYYKACRGLKKFLLTRAS